MRQDILKLIASEKNVTNVIILTHNIDFIFLQGIVVPKLKKCGHPTLTVFVDANCSEMSFSRQGQWVDGIGRRYRVVPMAMEQGFCFHPKAVMLSAQEKARLFIGSGNLGFGGWRENGESWISFDTDEDGVAPFAAFRGYLDQVLKRVPLNDSVSAEIEEAFDPRTRPWAEDLLEGEFVFGKCGAGLSLVEQLENAVGQGPFNRLTICTPYFDENAEMLLELAKRSNASTTRVLIQNGRSGLLSRAAAALPSGISIQPVDFQRDGNRSSFLHAKFYAFERDESVIVLNGSANCSRAALAIPGKVGNAEILAVQILTPADFREAYLEDLVFLDEDPDLRGEIAEPKPEPTGLSLRILGARFEHGQLHIGFICSNDISVTACFVDGAETEFEQVNEGYVLVHSLAHPNRVVLEGRTKTEIVRSTQGWIDHEFYLRSNSRRRTLVHALDTKVHSAQWNIVAYVDILRLFHQNLEYTDQKKFIFGKPKKQKRSEEKSVVYSESDIFSEDFGLPSAVSIRVPAGEIERIEGLGRILLRWFGFASRDETIEGADAEEESDQETDEEKVDKEEKLPVRPGKVKPVKAGKTELRRAKKVVEDIIDTMANPEFLRKRPPEQLGIDMAVTSILLQSGLGEKWLSHEDFFGLTHRLWSALFFSPYIDKEVEETYMGLLQYLYETSDDPDLFACSMTSVDLSVTLAAWALAVPKSSPETALFELGCVTSVARFPWLWKPEQREEVAAGLQENLIHTGIMRADDVGTWNTYRIRWKDLIQTGYAIGKLERSLIKHTPADLKDQISTDAVHKGELLWQGHTGLCVAGEDCRRSEKRNVQAFCLHRSDLCRKFAAGFLIPLDALLESDYIVSNDALGRAERNVLKNYMCHVEDAFRRADEKQRTKKKRFCSTARLRSNGKMRGHR